MKAASQIKGGLGARQLGMVPRYATGSLVTTHLLALFNKT